MKKIYIHKKPFAVGLHWFTGKTKLSFGDIRRKATQEFRDDEAVDMVCFRQRQFGFGESGGNVRSWKGVRSLAAVLRITSQSFLGLFCLEENGRVFWWVYAMSQSLVVGMGDQIFESKIEAEEWILNLKGLLDSDFEESAFCETVEDSIRWLSPLVPSLPKLFRRTKKRSEFLQALHSKHGQRLSLALIGVLSVFVLLGVVGVKAFIDHQSGKAAVEAARVALLNKEQRKRELLLNPEKHFLKPWITAPKIHEFTKVGLQNLLKIPLVSSGWVLERAIFDGKSIVAYWGFLFGADYLKLPFNGSLHKPNQAVSKTSLKLSTPDNSTVKLASRAECTRLFYEGTEVIGAKLNLKFNPPETKKIENIEITCPWMCGEWVLSNIPNAMVLDGVLPNVFLHIPGMVIEEIEFHKDKWNLKGAIYATK